MDTGCRGRGETVSRPGYSNIRDSVHPQNYVGRRQHLLSASWTPGMEAVRARIQMLIAESEEHYVEDIRTAYAALSDAEKTDLFMFLLGATKTLASTARLIALVSRD